MLLLFFFFEKSFGDVVVVVVYIRSLSFGSLFHVELSSKNTLRHTAEYNKPVNSEWSTLSLFLAHTHTYIYVHIWMRRTWNAWKLWFSDCRLFDYVAYRFMFPCKPVNQVNFFYLLIFCISVSATMWCCLLVFVAPHFRCFTLCPISYGLGTYNQFWNKCAWNFVCLFVSYNLLLFLPLNLSALHLFQHPQIFLDKFCGALIIRGRKSFRVKF